MLLYKSINLLEFHLKQTLKLKQYEEYSNIFHEYLPFVNKIFLSRKEASFRTLATPYFNHCKHTYFYIFTLTASLCSFILYLNMCYILYIVLRASWKISLLAKCCHPHKIKSLLTYLLTYSGLADELIQHLYRSLYS